MGRGNRVDGENGEPGIGRSFDADEVERQCDADQRRIRRHVVTAKSPRAPRIRRQFGTTWPSGGETAREPTNLATDETRIEHR